MKTMNRIQTVLALTACLTWAMPQQAMANASGNGQVRRKANTQSAARRSVVRDVKLDSTGQLRGQVVNAQGHPAERLTIRIARPGRRPFQEATTAQNGHFSFRGLRGGVYQVQVGNSVHVYRAWAHRTAPPSATNGVLIVSSQRVQNGQNPVTDLLFNRVTLLVGIGAAIVIPIVSANGGGEPVSY